MSNKLIPTTDPGQPKVYQIIVRGHLGPQWSDWFEGLTITLESDGDTLLTGPVIDQAALHGLIKKVRDLGLPLVSVDQAPLNQTRRCSIRRRMKTTKGMDPKIKLSLLWIFVILNMAYADILSLMDPASPIRAVIAGAPFPTGGLLAGAVLMETSIVMVSLSWILNYKVNRWVTVVIGALNILAVAIGGHGLYYVFFATVEVASMLLIIWFAWQRTDPEMEPE